MNKEERKIITNDLVGVLQNAIKQKVKLKEIERFFGEIADCSRKITRASEELATKNFNLYRNEETAKLKLERAQKGWDMLLPFYYEIKRLQNQGLSLDKIESMFSKEWDHFYIQLHGQNFEYEQITVEPIKTNTKPQLSTIHSVAETPRQAQSGINPAYQAYCDEFGNENKNQILSFEDWKTEQNRELMEKLHDLSMIQTDDEPEPKKSQHDKLFADDEVLTEQQTNVQNVITPVKNLLPNRPKLDNRIKQSESSDLSVLGTEQQSFFRQQDLEIQRRQMSPDLKNKKLYSQGEDRLNKHIGLPLWQAVPPVAHQNKFADLLIIKKAILHDRKR